MVLPKSHVVGQARPETELREEVEPAHAHLLVGPQRAVQRRAGVDAGQSLRAAQTLQRFCEPGARRPPEPTRRRHPRQVIAGCDVGAGEHTHGLPKAEPVLRCRALDLAEVLQHAAQPLAVDFDPTAADQRQPIGFRQQLLDLGGGQAFAVESDLHVEIEQRVLAQVPTGALPPTVRRHLRARRPVGPPGRRHSHHHPGALQLRDVSQKLNGLLGRPPQRVEDLARVDHGLQPRAGLRRSLHGKEQRQQTVLVRRARVLAAEPDPAEDVAPWHAPTTAWCRWRERRMAPPRPCGFRPD